MFIFLKRKTALTLGFLSSGLPVEKPKKILESLYGRGGGALEQF